MQWNGSVSVFPAGKGKSMKSKIALLRTLVVMSVLMLLVPVNVRSASRHRTLRVKLNYTGTAKVDQTHKIYVLLFDANPYTASRLVDVTGVPSPPPVEAGVSHVLRREAASGKNQTLTFSWLANPSVYVMAFLDKTGKYDPHEDSPSGSPMGVYGKANGNADPIALKEGKTTKIVLAFDDSHKTP